MTSKTRSRKQMEKHTGRLAGPAPAITIAAAIAAIAAITVIAGGALADLQVTTGSHSHASITWSPDGTMIFTTALGPADVANQITATPSSGGAPLPLTAGPENHDGTSVSPSGELLYTNDLAALAPQVAWMPAGGGPETLITSPPDLHSNPQFSPDGSAVLYMQSPPVPDPPVDIWVQPFPAGPPVLWVGGSTFMDPQWSPDGAAIACINDDGSGFLQVFVLSGPGTVTQLTFAPFNHIAPRWSPDGSLIACIAYDGVTATEIWKVEVASGIETALVADGLNHGFPTWAPDGSRLAYTTELPSSIEIHAVSPDGAISEVVTGGPDFRTLPAYSPDGDRLAYLAYTGFAPPKVWTIDLAGTGAIGGGDGAAAPVAAGLVALHAAPNPFFRAGGTQLRFATAARGRVSVEIFDAGGRLVRRLLDGPLGAGEHRLAWDGRADHGGAVASGTYFARVATGGGTAGVQKLVLSK